MPPLAEWVALVGAISAAVIGLIKATAEASKTRAEVVAMRAELAKGQEAAQNTAQLVAESHHQLTPNGGGSIKDATTRLEAAVAELRDGQSRMAASTDRLEAAQDAASKDIRGLRRDVGRLADSDFQLTVRADKVHERIHQRIDDIAVRLPDPLADPHVD